ncbi:DNA repair exonuclease [Candidatus Woesearchaeota archaeon]|nr:DNA repair exonuclease [Candidatus Woesearchaeota archaeon]
MKFAHMSDVHIGSWRDSKMRDISTNAFVKAIDMCIEMQVDFILISGDLFNTSLPTIDRLKIVVEKLQEVKKKNIAVYVIAGSHDFSPSGKTMLDVIESAELFVNVVKGFVKEEKLHLSFTVDNKTGAKITGMLGKKGMLDKYYYQALSLDELEKEDGFKIFMFHTAITEFKPSELELMDSTPLSYFPKGFNYYAGGHVHYIFQNKPEKYGLFTYPGALFPNNFRELEKYKCGGFYIYENDTVTYHPVMIYDVVSFEFDCEDKTVEEVHSFVLQELNKNNVKDKIATLRFWGKLLHGKASDIDFRLLFQQLYERGAYFIMKNITRLTSKEFISVITDLGNNKNIEESIIDENIGNLNDPFFDGEEKRATLQLLQLLSAEKLEGERSVDFDERIKKDILSVLPERLKERI